MFPVKKNEDTELETEIKALLFAMRTENRSSKEYTVMVDQLTKLYSLRPNRKRASADTLAIVAGNLAGILLIVLAEDKHVITSKAVNFVMKAR